MDIISIVTGAVSGLAIGAIVVATILRKNIERKSQQLIRDAEAEAEVKKKEKILQAKEKFHKMKVDHEKDDPRAQ